MSKAAPQLSASELTDFIKQKSSELGFSDCGISEASYLADEEERLNNWLAEERHGLMGYMERNKEKRLDPRKLVPGAKSVITILQNYYPPKKISTQDNYKISKYAYGNDYHDIVKEKLHKLAEQIKVFYPQLNYRAFVDSAPVMDRVWAQKSGLGWIGKNSLLLTPKGSYFFIGHLITDLDLRYNTTEVANACANCRRCINACPTKAIYEDYKVDARKCLSYQTIEFPKRAERTAPRTYRNWIFGCDICQDVCPWNVHFAVPHNEKAFFPKPKLSSLRKTDWESLTEMQFGELFRKSAIKRAKYSGIKQTLYWLKNE